ncbi:MAG: TIGR02117 family protein [Pseudomonadota bacterium]
MIHVRIWARRASLGLLTALGVLMLLMAAGIAIPRPPSTNPISTGPISTGPISASDGPSSQPTEHRIFLISNAIHTDIAVPATPAVLETFNHLSKAGFSLDYGAVHWVVFGWGSRAFYINTPTWADLKPGPALTALTLDRQSVMHVTRASGINTEAPGVMEIHLSQTGFDRLLKAIDRTFKDTEDPPGVDLIEGANHSQHSAFFAAKGWFTALLGCNTWTARMLREAGLTTGWWTPLPVSLIWSLKAHD